ncbi:MAG: hypothetical protein C0521_00150 [Xanthomonas sp.]|nr:hypothetical protein [Xanthomonas sp.]MBL8257725.1 ABATE domain-containing protein [Pseudoxanthomonas mexicana]
MSVVASPDGAGGIDAPQVGDHLALDLLNTEARYQGHVMDFWTTGEAVHRWLVRQGVATSDARVEILADLLVRGRALRAAVREAIAVRKAGGPVAVDILNDYLQAYETSPLLQRDDTGAMVLVRVPRGDATASLLGPVAEAAAELLVEGDFALVRQCEHPDCILWFYDRTKSHKRRWCSMAQCGNRHKATLYRERKNMPSPT